MIVFQISLFITFCIFVYFLPTIIAVVRNKKNKLAIFVLNAFLGFTFIFWVLALVWAVLEEDKF